MAEIASEGGALESIAPLIEYYERELGPIAGRLMSALSFLTDLEDSHGWNTQAESTRQTVHISRLLIASAFRLAVADQTRDMKVAILNGDDWRNLN